MAENPTIPVRLSPLLRKYQIAFAALEKIATGRSKHPAADAREAMQRCIDIAEDEASAFLCAARDNVPIDHPRRHRR